MKKTKIKFYVFGLLLILLLTGGIIINTGFVKEKASTPPNIIIILLDDAGYADFGFMGAKDLQTPNIDALAGNAVRFTDAHVSSTVCSPSRAGLLTGKYQQRFGYECNEGDGYSGLDGSQILLSHYMKKCGYTTAAFGKWHLGFKPEQHPLNKGFDYYYGFLSGSRSYFYNAGKDDKPGSNKAMLENFNPVTFSGYLTDALGDKAVEYIAQHKSKPFFMYWAPNAVHTPMEATEADLKLFDGRPRQMLAAMTYSLDRAIGNIISTLKQQGIYDNTLIFFLSDNGGAHDNQSSNYPLKGFKGNKFEGGHRIPYLVSWPKKFLGGKEFNGITSSLDIFATSLHAAGIRVKKSFGLDGVSLLPYLFKTKRDNPHQELVWRKDFAAAIRMDDFKLIKVKEIGEVLYNLKNDPGESMDLSTRYPGITKKLSKQLLYWEQTKINPLWTEGALWDTITLMIHDDLMHSREVRVKNPEQLNKYRSKKLTTNHKPK
jgi:arylsulfatase A-like enzyme